MIFRLSQKLATRIKATKLPDSPLANDRITDWSSHAFNVGRTQYIILTNTASLYSCLMNGKGNTNQKLFVDNAIATIRDFTADDGLHLAYRMHITPAIHSVTFAKPLNRSVISSVNDLLRFAKYWIDDGTPYTEVGYQLNKIPFSCLVGTDGRDYAQPKEVFLTLLEGSHA